MKDPPAGLGLRILLLLWVVVLFDPHWLLAAYGLSPILKIRLVLTMIVTGMVLVGVPSVPSWGRRWDWHVPLLAFIGVGVVNLPFVINHGVARMWLQEWLLYWVLVTGTIAVIDSPRRVELLMALFGLSFLWYGLWGARQGQVTWHTPLLFNPDGYGALMVIGLGFSAYMAMAQDRGWWRRMMMLTSALCVIGVVASFARGAFLAVIVVFAVLWLRSRRKGATLVAGVVGTIVLMGAVAVLHGDVFWVEIRSVFEQGTSEGTGEDRWELWKAAWQVFLQRPVLGAGPNNWGVFASEFFSEGDLGSRYTHNTSRLYLRSLHNLYMQTLSEMGVVGTGLFVWILVDFWKRNRTLRKPSSRLRWRQLGGRFDLRSMALALELAMIGFLAIAAVYSTAGKHWFFTIQGLNLLLYAWVIKEWPRHVRNGAVAGESTLPHGSRAASPLAVPRRAVLERAPSDGSN